VPRAGVLSLVPGEPSRHGAGHFEVAGGIGIGRGSPAARRSGEVQRLARQNQLGRSAGVLTRMATASVTSARRSAAEFFAPPSGTQVSARSR
jgi:hypothetical protein